MKIVNATTYDTKHLKAIIRRVADDELNSAQRKALAVRVDYTRGRWPQCRGGRTGMGAYLRLRLPRTFNRSIHMAPFGVVLAWAMARMICGVGRDVTKGCPRYSYSGNWNMYYAYLNTFPLDQCVPVIKKITPAIRVSTRLQHARAQVARWTTKLKLTETKLKTWEATVKYHERRVRMLEIAPLKVKVKAARKPKVEDLLKKARESLLRKGHGTSPENTP